MPDRDILSALAKDPLYQKTAAETDALIGSDFVERAQKHEQEKNFQDLNQARERSILTSLPNGTPLNVPYRPTIATPPQNKPISDLTPTQKSRQYQQQITNLIQNPNAWTDKSKDWSKPYGFDTGARDVDFDRYYAYGKPFQKLGYSPFRNNELVYSQNTSWWDDFVRMGTYWPSLAGEAFMTGLKQWKNPLDFSPDIKVSADYEKTMGMIHSTRGGLGGEAINLFANSAYTIGLLSEMVAETVVVEGASLGLAATGVGAPAAGALTSAHIAKTAAGVRRLVQAGTALKDIGKGMKTTMTALNAVDDINKAREVWKGVRGIGSAAFSAINPLQGTSLAKLSKNIYSGKDGFDKLKDLAVLKKGAGALYMDIRELNFAVAEARMEGGSVQNEVVRDLNDEFYKKHGKMAEGKDAEAIANSANAAGVMTSLTNAGVVYMTNKLVFGKAIRGFKPAALVRADLGKGLTGTLILDESKRALGKNVAEVVKGGKKFLRPEYWKQAPWQAAGGLIRYSQANWVEGAQESIQDVIAQATSKYYKDVYEDPALAGSRQAWGAFEGGAKAQLSEQGVRTFMGGFLMGALVGPVQNAIYVNGWEKVQQMIDHKEYERLKKQKIDWTNRVVDAINNMDPKKYFNAFEKNMVTQVSLDRVMNDAMEEGDQKKFHDAKNDSLFEHFEALLQGGGDKFDYFVNRLEDLKTLSSDELKELADNSPVADKFNKSTSIHERIDGVIARAKQVKRRYDEVSDRYQDEPNMYQFSKTKNPVEFEQQLFRIQAWREAKKQATYANYGFDISLQRMDSIVNDMLDKNAPLKNVSASKFTILFNREQTNKEIDLLRSEAEIYATGTPQEKKKAAASQATLEKLEKFSVDKEAYENAYKELANSKGKGKKKKVLEYQEDMRESYYAYVKHLAAQNGEVVLDQNLEGSFDGIRDHVQLGDDASRYAAFINVLHDPENFWQLVDRLQPLAEVTYRNRTEAMLKGFNKYLDREDENGLLHSLFSAGVFIDPKSIKDLKAGKLDKIEFLYATGDRGPVDKASADYRDKILPILKKFKLYKEIVREEKPAEPVAPVTTVVTPIVEPPKKEEAPIVVPEVILTEFEQKLAENQKLVKGLDPTEKFYMIENPETGKVEKYKRVTSITGEDFDGDESLYQDARNAGNTVDKLVREFFLNDGKDLIRPGSLISQSAFDALKTSLEEIKKNMDAKKLRFLTNNGVLFDSTLKIAGTVDILAIDEKGNISIYDVKTMKEGKYANYNLRPIVKGVTKMSKRDTHSRQLSGYSILLRNQYGIDSKDLAVVPFELVYDSKGKIAKLVKRPGIEIKYDRTVEKKMARKGAPKAPEAVVPTKKKKKAVEEPVITTPTGSATVPGSIIYASPGSGKTALVRAFPDKYVDGDEILFQYVKELAAKYPKDITVPKLAQGAGAAFYQFYKFRKRENKPAFIIEIQDRFNAQKEAGKTVLTSNWFAKDMADEVYLVKDSKEMAKVFKERGASDEDAVKQANRKIEEEGKSFPEETEEGIKPKVLTTSLAMALEGKEIPEEALFDKMVKEIQALKTPKEVDAYYEQFVNSGYKNIDVTAIEDLLKAQKKAVAKNATFANTKKEEFVKMTNKQKYKKGAKVIAKTKEGITVRPVGEVDAVPEVITKKDFKKKVEAKVVKEEDEETYTDEQDYPVTAEDMALLNADAEKAASVEDNPEVIRDSVKEGLANPEAAKSAFDELIKKCNT